MTYKTLRDVLAWVREIHREASACCAEASHASDPRSAFLADCYKRWQDAMRESFAGVEEQHLDAPLDTWVQYVPEAGIEEALTALRRAHGEGPEALLREVSRVQGSIVSLLAGLRDGPNVPPGARDALAAVVEFEEDVLKKLGNAEVTRHDL